MVSSWNGAAGAPAGRSRTTVGQDAREHGGAAFSERLPTRIGSVGGSGRPIDGTAYAE
jgi:hypothetical protein